VNVNEIQCVHGAGVFRPLSPPFPRAYGNTVPVRLIIGGLRPGTVKPMDEASKASARSHYVLVQKASGQPFDFAFFERECFVYGTKPASRAVS
jgi:putative protein-disulfide isomerase